MFSRFCKLCHNRADIAVGNLRRYRISPTLLREPNDTDDNVVDNEDKLVDKKKDDRNPIIVCKRPQFNFYPGTTYSKFDTIPLASQGWHHSKSIGDYFTIYPVDDEPEEEFQDKPETFQEFGLHPKLIENLEGMNIREPTEIQKMAIPTISMVQHSVLSAETGCGKTFAYLLPIINNIIKWKAREVNDQRRPNHPYAMIITPSRELAVQIGTEIRKISKDLNIKHKVVTSGRTKRMLMQPSVGDIDLLIGTFGVMSKLVTNKIYKLDYLRHVVLDEAHALFHETFEKLEFFLRRIPFTSGDMPGDPSFPTGCQLSLVSATKATEYPEYLNKVLDIDSLVESSTKNFHRVMVPQKFLRLTASDKPRTLLKLIKPKAAKKQPIIVFSNDSKTCDWLCIFLNEFGINTINVNGGMSMIVRTGKFASFQRGEYTVLSATNAGALGLDTVAVNNVVNYDFPMETADYIHRCGRTGRLGTRGDCRVTNLIARPLEIELTRKIERATRRSRALPIFSMVEEHEKRKAAGELTIKKKTKNSKPEKKSRTTEPMRKKKVESV